MISIRIFKYSNLTQHHSQRDKAWEIHPYPCLGQFRFLDLSVTLSPHYPTILSRLKNNHETYLDLGCCFGQDIRKLVYDGVPSTQTYGCDLRTDFLDYGFDLFRDRDTLKTKFFQADVFDPNSDLNQLDGKVDILYAGSFLHLFPYSQQVEVCVRITELLADKEGSVVLGRQVGNSEAKPFESVTNPGQMILRHNAETFKKMWQEVENLTGTRWRVDVELLKRDDEAMPNQGTFTGDRALRFAVFRQTAVELE